MAYESKYLNVITNFFLVFLGLLVGMSALVAFAVPVVKYGFSLSVVSATSGLLYLLFLVGVLAWIVRWRPNNAGQTWLWILMLATLAVKILLIIFLRDYQQLGDRATFLYYVDALAEGGLNSENLDSLTVIFDWLAWLSRAFPFALPIRWIFGAGHLFAFQIFNAALSTFSLYLFYRLASHLLGPAAVRAACTIYALIPLRFFYPLEYTHQFQVEFYVLAATLLIIQFFGSSQSRLRYWVKTILLGLILFLLRLNLGWDYLMLAFIFISFAVMISNTHRRESRFVRIIALCLICLTYFALSAPYDRWARAHETHSSGWPSFIARGWSLNSLGEYDGLPEQMEVATPAESKDQLMYSYILSQIYYHPRDVVLKLLPAKMAKYFLVGYATDMDWTFRQSGRPILSAVFTGLRLFFAPVFLIGLVLGCAGLIRQREKSAEWLLVTLLPVLACGIFVLFGETSPKYSFYVHAHMSLIAVYAAKLRARTLDGMYPIRRIFSISAASATVIIGLYFLVILLMVGIVRAKAGPWVFKNIRLAGDGENSRPCFERTLLVDDAAGLSHTASNMVSWPSVISRPFKTALYFWPVGDVEDLRMLDCRLFVNGRDVYAASLEEMGRIVRVEWLSGGEEDQSVSVSLVPKRMSSGALVGPSAGVRWGYVYSIPVDEKKLPE